MGLPGCRFVFAYKGSQYINFDCLQSIATQIAQDASPQIVKAPLMLISRMGQGVCLLIIWS